VCINTRFRPDIPTEIANPLIHRILYGLSLRRLQSYEILSLGRRAPSETMKIKKILVVDDEKGIADTLVLILNESGFDARAAYDGKTAIREVLASCPEILLSDVLMPGVNGVEAAKLALHHCPDLKVVLFSGQAASLDLVDKAKEAGFPFQLLAKPIEPEDLIAALHAA
jgi:CheY-like chemotaxis protein